MVSGIDLIVSPLLKLYLGVIKPAIRCLAPCGGVKHISGRIYEETRGMLRMLLENVICDSVTYTENPKRCTVSPLTSNLPLAHLNCHCSQCVSLEMIWLHPVWLRCLMYPPGELPAPENGWRWQNPWVPTGSSMKKPTGLSHPRMVDTHGYG